MKRLLLLLFGALALAGCRLDVDVVVDMQPDGTGTVTVTATADQELLDRVPGVLDDLRFEDAIANGWTLGEPEPGATGGATLTLNHEFHTDEELANVLNSIGPPLEGTWQVARTPGAGDTEGQVSNAVIGNLQLVDGFAAFSDNDLTAAVGGQPFAEQIAGATPEQSMSFTLRMSLPGELIQSSGTEVSAGVVAWEAPLDGTATAVEYQTLQRPADSGAAWAGPVSKLALGALIVWVVASVGFITFVVIARRSRRRRRNHALRNLR